MLLLFCYQMSVTKCHQARMVVLSVALGTLVCLSCNWKLMASHRLLLPKVKLSTFADVPTCSNDLLSFDKMRRTYMLLPLRTPRPLSTQAVVPALKCKVDSTH